MEIRCVGTRPTSGVLYVVREYPRCETTSRPWPRRLCTRTISRLSRISRCSGGDTCDLPTVKIPYFTTKFRNPLLGGSKNISEINRPKSGLLNLVLNYGIFTVGRSHVSPPQWSSTHVPFNHPGVNEGIELPPELQEPWWPEKCPAGGSETTTRHHIQAQRWREIQSSQQKMSIRLSEIIYDFRTG